MKTFLQRFDDAVEKNSPYVLSLGWLQAECKRHHHHTMEDGSCQEESLGFSWSSCDFCHSHLGGDRFEASMIKFHTSGKRKGMVVKRAPVFAISICADCLMYEASSSGLGSFRPYRSLRRTRPAVRASEPAVVSASRQERQEMADATRPDVVLRSRVRDREKEENTEHLSR